MKQLTSFILLSLLLISCEQINKPTLPAPNAWEKRTLDRIDEDAEYDGSTFLSIYSQIFTRDERAIYDLTATVSIHNPNAQDSVYLERAEYYNTQGNSVRTYFTKPVFILPRETVQIIIPVLDNAGGTGANFIFDWRRKSSLYDPIFEAVMVSSQGAHGISFVTEGNRLR